MHKSVLVMALVAFMAFVPSFVVSASDQGYDGHFGDMDLNGDGLVNWDEFKAYFPHATPDVFGVLAKGGDSFDHDVWHDFKKAHGYGHGGKEKPKE